MAEDIRGALLRASKPPTKELFSTLITANHILHHHNVVDAFGHISVRNPQNPNTFFLSRNLAPALVKSRSDIIEYRVEDSEPIDPEAPRGFAERFIHSEIYKKYQDVKSVIHAHNESVLPFSIGSVPLKPVFHMAGAIGPQIPIYDIQNHYKSSDPLHSLLITTSHLGAALAAGFNPGTTTQKLTGMIKNYITASTPEPVPYPPITTVLMRGHGFTCVGTSIEEAVYRAIYTCANARVQMQALLLQGTYHVGLVAERVGGKEGGDARPEGIRYLSERECGDSWKAIGEQAARPWGLWVEEVRCRGLYFNELDQVEA
ncbi:uncharacterized protein MYCFIDRAFT_33728 [Pseudocercospora fijiensis CIRAD86]|uniref:Class II aldolase/adducin N-terminal domain-containing protein n=1 Tax=Pseudocercospora fijiensis (strain CIRAD86) TaxID=383855 RepID=M2YJP4_PSEFD|nr:uncharacterized protein MYCFIDRAFT_33728 [Pseudocercospora fijiensis CIRAD86]EME77975.1 hypothetical protein MYCFIDRAFT_33728 [Pseudocercospora fijiensis CIRAD86]